MATLFAPRLSFSAKSMIAGFRALSWPKVSLLYRLTANSSSSRVQGFLVVREPRWQDECSMPGERMSLGMAAHLGNFGSDR